MDTTHATADTLDASLPSVAAARLRGYLAERRISHKTFGEMVGWDRGRYQLRLAGKVPLNLADLEEIEARAGISAIYLLTGITNSPPLPPSSGPRPSPVRRLRQTGLAVVPAVNNDDGLSDDAQYYVTLAEDLLPRVESNHQPSGYWLFTTPVGLSKSPDVCSIEQDQVAA